ncbi:MAG: hypothetical protein H6581_24170 [Bacteroidia bacterium]|nr:hypothetical protein [Bacteroidia bacterium]
MKPFVIQEQDTPWDYSVRSFGKFCLFFVFILLVSAHPGQVFATQPEGGENFVSHQLTFPSYQKWVLELTAAECAEASAEVTLDPGFVAICPSGSVTATLDASSHTLTVWLFDCNPSTSGDLALIEVWQRGETLVKKYRLESAGGQVIIVLVED